MMSDIRATLMTKKVRQLTKVAMIIAGLLTITFALLYRPIHPYFAVIFISTIFLHIYQHKNLLLK